MNLFSLLLKCIVSHKTPPILLPNPPSSRPPCEKIQTPVSLGFQSSARRKGQSPSIEIYDNSFHCPCPRHLEILLLSICEIQDFSTLQSAHLFRFFLLGKQPWTMRNRYHRGAFQILPSYISYCRGY